MADSDARNTISRSSFDGVISQVYDEVFRIFQKDGVPPQITQAIRAFEERFREETRADRLERVSNEVASTGLFVPDPAGGPSNLRLPHKQFYEYMIAKVAWIVLAHRDTLTCKLFQSVERYKNPFEKLLAEDLSLQFFSEIIGANFVVFRNRFLLFYIAMSIFLIRVSKALVFRKSIENVTSQLYVEEIDRLDFTIEQRRLLLMRVSHLGMMIFLTSVLFVYISYVIERASAVSFSVSLFIVIFVFCLTSLWTLMQMSRHGSFPRLATLRRIVSARLKDFPEFSGGPLPILTLQTECLLVLSSSSKSMIIQIFNEKLAKGEIELSVQGEFRNLIAPLA